MSRLRGQLMSISWVRERQNVLSVKMHLFLRNLNKFACIAKQQNISVLLCNNSFRGVRQMPGNKMEFQELDNNMNPVGATTPIQVEKPINKDIVPLDHPKHKTVKKDKASNHDDDNDNDIILPPITGEANIPTFNLAAYVNKSLTLQQFLQLGVNLHSIERRKGLAEFVLRLDFEENVKPYLVFLSDQGVPAERFGELITKNPLLFKVDMDHLQTRLNYLEAKNFTAVQRQRILTLNPYWLMFSTKRIDKRLSYFQKQFKLSGDDIRFLSSKQPRLITYNMEHIRKTTFCIQEEMGFSGDELRCLLLSKPKLWMLESDELIERFSYAHNEMGLSHDMLLQFPEVLTSREFRLRERHEFLKMLGRAQYAPDKDLYISPRAIVEGNNFQFVRNVAKSDLQTFELFLKTR